MWVVPIDIRRYFLLFGLNNGLASWTCNFYNLSIVNKFIRNFIFIIYSFSSNSSSWHILKYLNHFLQRLTWGESILLLLVIGDGFIVSISLIIKPLTKILKYSTYYSRVMHHFILIKSWGRDSLVEDYFIEIIWKICCVLFLTEILLFCLIF